MITPNRARKIVNEIPEEHLRCFVQWCQINPDYTEDIEVVRAVMAAYISQQVATV